MTHLLRRSLQVAFVGAFALAIAPREASAGDPPSFSGARMVAMDELAKPWPTSRPLGAPVVESDLVAPWARPASLVTPIAEVFNPWPTEAQPQATLVTEIVDPWARIVRRHQR